LAVFDVIKSGWIDSCESVQCADIESMHLSRGWGCSPRKKRRRLLYTKPSKSVKHERQGSILKQISSSPTPTRKHADRSKLWGKGKTSLVLVE
jgi:hypothetical protein